MPADRFDVIFRGQLMEGQDSEHARQEVGRLFKANDAQLQRLFSGKPVSIKQNVDMDTASRYRLAFRQAGALVEIRASRPADAPKPVRTTEKTNADFSLSPANTGSLEAYAARVTPAPLPDISALSLAAAGSDHEQAPNTSPPDIDIDALSLVPGQDWSLEDCQPPPLPIVEPDISELDLAEPDDTSHIPPEPPPLPLPDISELSLQPAEDDDEENNP
jgi:hypothetical protein